ncbi:MAG: MFS transporter, partial [Acidimicrobiales bacterium]
VQGVFGALLAPAALSTLTVTFTEPGERGKAFGIFGAVAGGGSAVGLVLGGLLTEGLSWRWCLYVNLIFAAVALVGALILLPPQERKERTTLDLPGTLLASAGLFCIVYGFSHAASASWSSGLTVASLVAGVVLLSAFVVLETRVANPLLPLRIILDRTRGGALLAVVISGAAIFGVFLFLTFYLQGIKGYSPIVTGLMYLPMTACIVAASTTANIRLLPRTGPRPLAAGGMALGCVAMLLLSRLGVSSTYPGGVLPALLILGLGFGLIFAPAINGSTAGVAPDDAGVASAMVNTMQQVGGSIGTALLATVATGATTSYLTAHHGVAFLARGAVHGYHVAFLVSAATFLVGGVVCGLLLPAHKLPDPTTSPAPASE